MKREELGLDDFDVDQNKRRIEEWKDKLGRDVLFTLEITIYSNEFGEITIDDKSDQWRSRYQISEELVKKIVECITPEDIEHRRSWDLRHE